MCIFKFIILDNFLSISFGLKYIKSTCLKLFLKIDIKVV